MSSTIEWLISLLEANQLLAYAAIFVISVPEGPKLTILCGFLSSRGLLNPLLVYLLVVAGDVVGDSFWYGIGKFFGNPILGWFADRFGITPERLAQVRGQFESQSKVMLAASKLIHGPGVLGLVAAGSIKFPYLRYVLTCLVISSGQSALLLTLGIVAGEAYEKVLSGLNIYAALGVGIAIAVSGFFAFRWMSATLRAMVVRTPREETRE